jgi:hypothetical protein
MLQTEFEFTLPHGYADEQGNLHRHGLMRLATALDEVEPLSDPRVRANEAYLGIVLLSRVITRLGEISPVAPSLVERLFSSDFAFLQALYVQANDSNGGVAHPHSAWGETLIETQCPTCGTRFLLDPAALEEEPVPS